jgi:hypothetical protein
MPSQSIGQTSIGTTLVAGAGSLTSVTMTARGTTGRLELSDGGPPKRPIIAIDADYPQVSQTYAHQYDAMDPATGRQVWIGPFRPDLIGAPVPFSC